MSAATELEQVERAAETEAGELALRPDHLGRQPLQLAHGHHHLRARELDVPLEVEPLEARRARALRRRAPGEGRLEEREQERRAGEAQHPRELGERPWGTCVVRWQSPRAGIFSRLTFMGSGFRSW